MRYDLPKPFHVLATQNPLEQEGTYPLPEAQLDRFVMQIDVGYPDMEAERRMLFATTGSDEAEATSIMSPEDPDGGPAPDPAHIPVGDNVIDAILKLVHAARPDSTEPEVIKDVRLVGSRAARQPGADARYPGQVPDGRPSGAIG